jgi:predicted nucleic acid-binding protein
MPERGQIVINTGPLIALAAALDDLRLLETLYRAVHVPFEVGVEIGAKGLAGFAADLFAGAVWLHKGTSPTADVSPILRNSLDGGESAVIRYAINQGIDTVCIDEATGRRFARLSGLKLTGSLGILLRAKWQGHPIVLRHAIARMRTKWVWISDELVSLVLKRAGEE